MTVGRLLSTLTRPKTASSRLPFNSLLRPPASAARTMSATAARPDPFSPAKRVAGQRQDVWYEIGIYVLKIFGEAF